MKTQFDFEVKDQNGFKSFISIKANDEKQAMRLVLNKCRKNKMSLC